MLDDDVGSWIFKSVLDDTFTLGDNDQNIDVNAGGGKDTAILNLGGQYDGTFKGSADDTLRFAANVNISGINGGGSTTFGIGDFTNGNRTVTMTFAQHNGFIHPFTNTAGTQTINLTDGGTTTGDDGIEKYNLNTVGGSKNDVFTVAADNPNLTTGSQSVAFGNGTDTVVFGTGKFSGNMTNIGNGDTTKFTGNADVSGVNSGGKITDTADFNGQSTSTTMTVTQHNGFTQPFGNTGGTQTINLVNGGTATGDAGIENYSLVTGVGLAAYNFTVATGLPSQNVTVTATGAADTIRYGAAIFTGNLTGLSKADPDTVQFFGNANVSGVNVGGVLNAKTADFSNAAISVAMTLAQHNDFVPSFTGTTGTQTITLTTSGVATGDGGIERYFLANGPDTFTVAPDNGAFKQNVDVGTGSVDTLVFGTGVFTGTFANVFIGDIVKFTGNVSNISGVTGLAVFGEVFDFNNAAVSVTMTLAQYNAPTAAFTNTTGIQTITLTTPGGTFGDGGIENYFLSSGNETFTVANDNGAFKQNVDITSGGNDVIVYGNGTFTGNLVGGGAGDTVKFTGDANVSGVNAGAVLTPKGANFSDHAETVTMTIAQHNDLTQAFIFTGGTQTIVLTTSGTATGDVGIENYVLASGDDTFTVARDNGAFKQNVDISSGGNDTLNYNSGNSVFTGNLVGGGAGDTVQFTGIGGGTVDVKGVNGGAKFGPKAVSFSNTAVDATMTVVQHNDFTIPFTNTGNGGGTQTIRFSTDGTATGDLGIEQYFLGADGTNTNNFTVGIIGQNVTGLGDNDTVINPFGGLSGVLKGGGNTATGDTLILGAANTTLAAGSGEFENLTLTVNNGNVTSNRAAHNGFTGVINAPGNNTYTVNDLLGGALTGLAGFENYVLGDPLSAGFNFTFTNAQTGTVSSGVTVADTFNATAAQIANVTLLDGGISLLNDVLNITTDAAGLNLNTKTTGIEIFNLLAGSTSNVVGANGNNITINATGNTIFTMGSVGTKQAYNGGSGIDQVTFNVADSQINTAGGSDTVTSLVGGAMAATTVLDGGAGANILVLANGDNLSTPGALVQNFQTLTLANNGSVTMTGTQYGQFTTVNAPGNNTITLTSALLTTTFNGVENYVLVAGSQGSNYSINGDNQTITDNNTAGTDTAVVVGVHSNVNLTATSGVQNVVTDTNGGTNHTFAFGFSDDVLTLGGGHTGLNVNLGANGDTLNITGIASGTLNGDLGSGDTLHLENTADINGATVSGFEVLELADNASVTMTAATWDQFVPSNGNGNVIANGVETVTLSTTTVKTTASTGNGTGSLVENYVLSNTGNDFFTVNEAAGYTTQVDLTAGGSDFLTLNDTSAAALPGVDLSTKVINFTSGSGAGFDTLAVLRAGGPISNAGFYNIAVANTDVDGKAQHTAFTVDSSVATIAGTWTQAAAQTALGTAIGKIDIGFYTMTVYSGSNADVMAVVIFNADDLATARIDLVGVLQNVGVNTLVAQNFS
ncbi:MAG: hypothetical protein U1E60_01790 [Reyranellaceae bacterium]